MNAADLPLDAQVFFCEGGRVLPGKFVKNTSYDKEGRLIGSPILRDVSVIIEKPYAAWFLAPAADDPRWVSGKPVPPYGGGLPHEGQVVLTRYGTGHVTDDRATREPLPFPGFAGGPMTRYEGVVAWMPAEPLIAAALPVPAEVLNAKHPYQVNQERRQEKAAELGWQLALAMQNEGDLYRTHFWPFVQGALVMVQRKHVGLDDWVLGDNTGKSLLIQDWMAKLALNYLAKNPEAIDQEGVDYSMRIKLCAIAAVHLLQKYQAARHDEQRAAAKKETE